MVSEELQARFFEALDRENGSVKGAARVVGVSPSTAFGWARKAHPGRAEYDRLRASGPGPSG